MSRLMTIVMMLVVLAGPAAAQDISPRAVPLNDSFAGRDSIHWGPSVNVVDIEEATVQADEPLPSCAGAVNNNSVWYQIRVPAGKLKISITGQTFDAIVSLYADTFSITGLEEQACATGPVGPQILLKKKVQPGTYIVRIASGDSTPPPAMNLTLRIVVTPPNGIAAPQNDDFSTALPLVFNKTVTTPNIEYATPNLPGVTSCGGNVIGNSVMYKFTLPDNVPVNISTEGSALGYAPEDYRIHTVMRLYKQTGLNVYEEAACATQGGVSGSARIDMWMDAGIYFIEVGQTSGGLILPSNAVVRVAVGSLQVLTNGGFEEDLAGWTLKNATTDGVYTGVEAITGSKSFRIHGGPDEATRLKQNIPLSMINLGPNAVLEWRTSIECVAIPEKNMTVKIKAIYSGGETETITFPLDVPVFTDFLAVTGSKVLLKRKKPVSLQVSIINKAASGDCLLDDMQLTVISTYGARNVLPVPPPAQ